MSYKQAHRQIALLRGPAKDKWCSAPRCDRAAEEWALNLDRARKNLLYDGNRVYSNRVEDYDPLCRRCHRMSDGNVHA